MKLNEIMTSEVEVLHPDDTIQIAAQKMRDLDIGFLPVLQDDELVGVITDRDLVVRMMADGVNAKAMIGRDILTSPVIYCFEDQEIDEAMDLLQEHRIRRLVVLDSKDSKIVGVLSLGDLATRLAPGLTEPILREISGGLVKAH